MNNIGLLILGKAHSMLHIQDTRFILPIITDGIKY